MVIGHRRSPISPSKLTKIVSRHEQMRISYQQLKSQIDTGLAEEVFASLSIPLMKLADLSIECSHAHGEILPRYLVLNFDFSIEEQDPATRTCVMLLHDCVNRGKQEQYLEKRNDQTPSGDKFKLKLAGAAACAALPQILT
uniref:Uncharacterized protein n=1 Tax=Salix viminalis TaxID=40686 RepID=A0A6N2LZB3_SALVM